MFDAAATVVDAARHAALLPRALLRRPGVPADRSRAVTLFDLVERLDLFVSAVFARRFRILPAAPHPPARNALARFRASCRAPLRSRDPVPATDGTTIWLPPALPCADRGRAGAIYRAMALAQASRAQRGAACTAEGLADVLERSCFLLVEAWSVQECLVAMLPGMRPAMAMLAEDALGRRPPLQRFPASGRPLEEFARSLMQRSASDCPVCSTPAESRAVAQRLAAKLRSAFRSTDRPPDGLLYVDLWTGELLSRPPAPGAPAGDAPQTAGAASLAHVVPALPTRVREARENESWDAVGGWIARSRYRLEKLEDPMGFQRPADRRNGAVGAQSPDAMARLAESRRVAAGGAPNEVSLPDASPGRCARCERGQAFATGDELAYPEWDWKRGDYRRPGAIVRIVEPLLGSANWVEQAVKAHRSRLEAVGRQFEPLRAQRARLPRRLDGDEIDLEAYIESHCDFRAGLPRSQAVYAVQRPARRELALMLLVDVSSSTDAWLTQDRRIIDVEREALLLLCLAMRRLGHRCCIQAFSGKGPSCVTVRTVKRFDEDYGSIVGRRIAALQPERYTRAGAAMRHACAQLMREAAPHRLLLMLSDGKPNDIDDYDGRYGIEDLRQSVFEARLQGISPFCLTVDHQAGGYVPAVFGVNHCVLPRPESLATALLEWVRRLARD